MLKVILTTSAPYTDDISKLLTNAKAVAISLEDAADEPLFPLTPDEMPLWQQVKVIALFPKAHDIESMIALIKICLPENAISQVKVEAVKNEDWVRKCQDQFRPIKISNKVWIYPNWYKPENPKAINVMTNPGLAFGTGEHPTTQLCLKWLADNIKNNNEVIIDYGCGSGILGLTALKLGANKVYFVDNDPQALEATTENIKLNQINKKAFNIYLPLQMPKIKADIIVANILANPLIELKNTFFNLLKKRGYLILSGILTTQFKKVIHAYQNIAEIMDSTEHENWKLLALKLM